MIHFEDILEAVELLPDDKKEKQYSDDPEKKKEEKESDKQKMLKPAGTKVLLITGRFQPFHLAHKKIAENGLKASGATKIVIGVVRGRKSSEDKTKNPLDYNYQKALIKRCLPKAEVVEISNSFIPVVVLKLRKHGYEVVGIVSGDDRSSDYKSKFKYFDEWKQKEPTFVVPKIKPFSVNRKSGEMKDISATNIRKAIIDDDQKTFKKMMPEELHNEWDVLRKKIT
jgi:FAD synthase